MLVWTGVSVKSGWCWFGLLLVWTGVGLDWCLCKVRLVLVWTGFGLDRCHNIDVRLVLALTGVTAKLG